MLSVTFSRAGPAREVIQMGEIATPKPGFGEVRVRLYASGINPTDIKSRTYLFERVAHLVPVIPHLDGAGVIDMVGMGVDEERVGERVWITLAQWRGSGGTCAEYVVMPGQYAFPLPNNMSFAEGACLGVPALTAMKAIRHGGNLDGKTVLITGGASAVGHYALQLAKLAGAEVFSTISNNVKAKIATAAGASHTLNYKEEDIGAGVSELTNGNGVDHMTDMDMSTYMPLYPKLVAIGGSIAAYGSNELSVNGISPQDFFTHLLTLASVFLLLEPEDSIVDMADEITKLCMSGKLIHNLGATFPLESTAEAHSSVELGSVTGNVVIDIP